MTVAVLYGFCEGKRLAKKFNDCLRQAGFAVVEDASAADVIIAHSGGCYLVPKNARAKLIIFVGVPLLPGTSLPRRLLRKVSMDFSLHWRKHETGAWLGKTFWNTCYFWRISTDIKMLHGQKSNEIFAPKRAQLVLIRNEDDALSLASVQTILPRAAFYELPGQHDDLWQHPMPYIAIIQNTYTAES